MEPSDNGRRARVAGGLAKRLVTRFVAADGTSHVRALAYQSMFIVISGFVGLVGLASVLDAESVRNVVVELSASLAPGPSADLLAEAAQSGSREGPTAAVIGLGAALIAGTLAMAQLERSANRVAGSDHDRPAVIRYVTAFALAATVGLLLGAGGLVLAGGRAVATGLGWSDELESVWSIARWPAGIVIVLGAVLLLYRFAPRIPITRGRPLWIGVGVAVVLWVAFTVALSVYFSLSSGSSPYGSLLSIIALLLWSMLTSLALHVGLATAAQLSGAAHPGRAKREDVRAPADHRVSDRTRT